MIDAKFIASPRATNRQCYKLIKEMIPATNIPPSKIAIVKVVAGRIKETLLHPTPLVLLVSFSLAIPKKMTPVSQLGRGYLVGRRVIGVETAGSPTPGCNVTC